MKKYLFAVQDQNGREVLAAEIETDKVSDVTATISDGKVSLEREGEEITSLEVTEGQVLTLHRWPADDKLSEPVSKPITE
jgi:hypothetical protein